MRTLLSYLIANSDDIAEAYAEANEVGQIEAENHVKQSINVLYGMLVIKGLVNPNDFTLPLLDKQS